MNLCTDTIKCLPLYSRLSPEKQDLVFQPAPLGEDGKPGRKIIFATNIAETSLTIDGIVFVVDCGHSKQKKYIPSTNLESLTVHPISQVNFVIFSFFFLIKL